MPKLTKRFVETIQPDPVETLKYWDTELKGFGLVVLPSGRRTYCIKYRNTDYIQKRVKIGVHGQITAEEARNLAKIQLGKVAHGEDLAEAAKQVRHMPIMNELAEQYLKLYAENEKRPKSIREDKAMLQNYILKEFGSRKVDGITFQDIQILHASLSKKRVRSNRILALLHKMFNLAIQWGWRADNPASGIKKYQEYKRTRWLQEDEMKRLLSVLDAYSDQTVANIIRLLLLTGARKHEVLEATWDQFDIEKGIWTKNAHTTKQKKMEYSPLSPSALTIMKKIREKQNGSPFLFPGKVKGKPIQDIKKSWATICKQANLKDFKIHDLRHTYASHLVSSGLSLSIVGKLLGHTQAATTQRYAHLADEPLREATALFGEKFKELSDSKE
jgi:integrase